MASVLFTDTAGNTPAQFGQSVARVGDLGPNVRTGLQSSTALRPLAGRAPTDVRNRLVRTEEFFTAPWTHASGLIGDWTGGFPDPFGGNGAFRFKPVFLVDPGWASRQASLRQQSDGNPGKARYSVYVKPINAQSLYVGNPDGPDVDTSLHIQLLNQQKGSLFFNLRTMQVVQSTAGLGIVSSGIIDEGDGWYRLWYTAQNTASGNGNTWISFTNRTNLTSFDPFPSGEEECLVFGPKLEVGEHIDLNAPPPPYQRVGASSLDITEQGVPSPYFLRFDLADDRIDHTFPNGFSGDVMIFGRNGSWVQEGVTIAPGGTLQIGPTTLNAGAIPVAPVGMLRALGNVVGWLPVARSITAQERQYMVDYYRERGAKGLLVPGPELRTATATVNGGWPESGGIVTAPGTVGTTDNVTFALSSPTVAGRFYEVVVPNNMPANGFYLDFGTGTGSQVGALSAFVQRIILTCTAPGSIIRVGRWAGTPTGTIGPISVREIRPEEEW